MATIPLPSPADSRALFAKRFTIERFLLAQVVATAAA